MARQSKYLDGLNPNQAEAVKQIEGPVLVIAGAGSGKTRVVTRRIAYIIAQKAARPEEILALTFTNKAAGEMRERVAELVGKAKSEKVVISTFHSFCLKVLREHIEILGYRKNFTISGESDTRTLVKRVIDDLEGLLEDFSPGIFREQISRMKGNQDTENFAMSVPADEEHEAKIALERMETIRLKTGAANEDFAILYRSNIQSRPYEIALRTAGIPYIVIGGQEFFERSEVRDVIAYLKVIVNPWDKASFLRVVNMPRRGIGDKTLHIIHDVCRQSGLSLGKGMAKALSEGKITGGAEKGIRSFLGSMRDYRYQFRSKKRPFHEILQHLIMTIGLKAELERTSKTPEMASLRWDNIQAIIKSLEEYESTERNPTLGGFLDQSSLTHDADRFSEDGTDRSVVTLMTIHSAKGLEFPYVFLVGAEDGIIRHQRSLRNNTIEEERRLFYVAITRAQRHFTIFETCSRIRHGRETVSTPSRFIKEILDTLIKLRIYAARDVIANTVGRNSNNGKLKKTKPKRRTHT